MINQTLAQSGVGTRARGVSNTASRANAKISEAGRLTVRTMDDAQRKIFESTKRYETASHRQKLKNIEAQKREEIAKIRELNTAAKRNREQAKTTFRNSLGTGATKGLDRTLAVGKAGAAMIGVGGSVLAGQAVSESLKLDEMTRRLSVNARGPGEAGRDPEAMRKQMVKTGMETGMSPEALAGSAMQYVAKTGDLDTALANLKNFAVVAQATGASVEDVASTAADLSQKFDIKGPKEMGDALAVLAFQGKKGAFELKDMAAQFPEMAAAANRAGLRGVGGMRTLGGLAQIARQSTGSGAEASTAVQMMMTQLTNKSGDLHSGKALGGKTVDVFEGGDPTKQARDLPQVLAEIISKSGGNMEQLSKLFDVRGIRAVSPMVTKFHDTVAATKGTKKEKEEAGKKAVLDMIKEASASGGSFGDVQKDAADVMKSTSIQFEMALMELKQVFADELMPAVRELAPHVKDLGPAFRVITRSALALAEAFLNNPMAGVGAIMAGSIATELAKAQLGELVKTGIVSPLGAAGLAITAFAASALAAKAYVDLIYAKAKGKVEEAAARGDEVRNKAKAEFDATGKISPETRKQLQELDKQESETAKKSDAVFKEGFSDTAGRAWNQVFGGSRNLDEKAVLEQAGGNEKYTQGRLETKGLLRADEMSKNMSGAEAKAAFGSMVAAAEKLSTAADKISTVGPNRTDSPSPVKK